MSGAPEVRSVGRVFSFFLRSCDLDEEDGLLGKTLRSAFPGSYFAHELAMAGSDAGLLQTYDDCYFGRALEITEIRVFMPVETADEKAAQLLVFLAEFGRITGYDIFCVCDGEGFFIPREK